MELEVGKYYFLHGGPHVLRIDSVGTLYASYTWIEGPRDLVGRSGEYDVPLLGSVLTPHKTYNTPLWRLLHG